MTNKFQTHDIIINQKPKKFVTHKFNTCYGDRVSYQLKRGAAPGNGKVSLRMSDLQPLHERWIADMYDYLKQQKRLMLNGFYKAGITGTVNSANKVVARIENPFTEKRAL